MIEVFKDVPNYEGIYQVSNFGNVKSLSRIIVNRGAKYSCEEKLMKPLKTKKGYLKICLYKNGKSKTFSIHVLVAMAFLDFIPNGNKFVIDHKNNVKNDNNLLNLQIISHRENSSKDIKKTKGKFVGVHWIENRNKWRSQIQIKGQNIILGIFETEEEGFLVYQEALKKVDLFKGNKKHFINKLNIKLCQKER